MASQPEDQCEEGVYVSLKELAKLEYLARGFSLLPRQPVHSVLAGRHGSRLRGRGLNFEELRGYRPGDDVRTIDWKATNRSGRPQVRVFTEERDRPVLLLVDQRQSMFFGSRKNMKSVTAAEAAALSAWRCLAQGDRVGCILFNDEEFVEVRPQRSKRHVLRMLEQLVQMNHLLNAEDSLNANEHIVNDVLHRALQVTPHDCLIVLVSDFSGADNMSYQLISRLARHNDVIAVFVYDRLETQLPSAGRLVFAGGDDRLEVNTSEAGFRDRFSTDYEQWIRRIRDDLLKQKTPVIPLDAGESTPEQIRRHMGQTIAARRKR